MAEEALVSCVGDVPRFARSCQCWILFDMHAETFRLSNIGSITKVWDRKDVAMRIIRSTLGLTRSSYDLHVVLVKLYMKSQSWCRRHIRFRGALHFSCECCQIFLRLSRADKSFVTVSEE